MEVWPSHRIGVRLSPLGQANDISDSDKEGTFSYTYKMLSDFKLAYLHVVERFPGNESDGKDEKLIKNLRKQYDGFYIANGDYDAEQAVKVIESGHADAVTFGRPFIANPDLPERFRLDAKLNEPNPDTFYGGDETGYTDYPFLDEQDENSKKEDAA